MADKKENLIEEEVKETYSLTDEEVSEFLIFFKINQDHSDFTLHLIYKD